MLNPCTRRQRRIRSTEDLFIYAIAPHKGMQEDGLPPHSTDYNYTHEQENQQINDDVLKRKKQSLVHCILRSKKGNSTIATRQVIAITSLETLKPSL